MRRHVLWVVLGVGMVLAQVAKAQDPNSQPVYFADGNLKAAVEAALGVKDPNVGDILRLTSLDASNRGIADITGLEYATNLTWVFLVDNQIEDISALSTLTRLGELRLGGNRITDISPLAGLTGLTYLTIPGNPISGISALSGLTNLTLLTFDCDQIKDVSALAGLTKLRTLGFTCSQVTDISGLAGLTELDSLSLGSGKVSDIGPLSRLTKLSYLDLRYNQIGDISALQDLKDLGILYLGANQIRDIGVLAGLTNLINLDLGYNQQIADIGPLAGLIELITLHVGGNKITDIRPLSGLTGLTSLGLGDNQIGDLSTLAGLTNLTSLILRGNHLNDIKVLSGLTNLTDLDLYNNQIADITPLAGLTSLRSLGLAGNSWISDISVLSGLQELTWLQLGGNQITDIWPLSGLTSLTFLDLSQNQISDISVLANLVDLRTLWLSRNQIADLRPLSGLSHLTTVDLLLNHVRDLSPLAHLNTLTDLGLGGNWIEDVLPLTGPTALTALKILDLVANPLRPQALDVDIPKVIENHPGLTLTYDPRGPRTLTVFSGPGGSVVQAAQGQIEQDYGTSVVIQAVANPGYKFMRWTGRAVDCGILEDPNASETTVILYANAAVTAEFDLMVVFRDAGLKAAVEETVGVKDPTPDDMLRLTSLNGYRRGITDLIGLEYAGNLSWLSLVDNRISDLSPLLEMSKLIQLSIGNNQIADVTPLAGLSNLTGIDLMGNRISDIRPLAGLTKLTSLDLRGNQISDLSPLSGLTKLGFLGLDGNGITNLSPLSGLSNLTFLALSGNQIRDLSALSGMTKLSVLWLGGNKIADVSPLGTLTGLTELRLNDNQIRGLSPLSGLSKLTMLWLGSNQIGDVGPLGTLTGLTELYLGRNPIIRIDPLAGLTKLTNLDLSNSLLTDIRPLANFVNLKWLNLYNDYPTPNWNQITDIGPLAGLTNLQWLSLGRNPVSNISGLSAMVNLQSLDLSDTKVVNLRPLAGLNGLTGLSVRAYFKLGTIRDIAPLAGLTNLVSLDLWGHQIEDIRPLAGLTELTYLNLRLNQIVDVRTLSGLTKLAELDLCNNRITDLSPLAGLTSLVTLRLGNDEYRRSYTNNNHIRDISGLAGLVNLTELDLGYNPIRDISPLAELTNLRRLGLAGTGISDIHPLSRLENLTYLDLASDRVGDISPLVSLIHLTYLGLGYNPLKAVAYGIYLPQIQTNNPGIDLRYDKMLLVDDDAPSDPGPGDPLVSDPLEDGTYERPFDAIQKAIDALTDQYGVLVMDGLYTGDGNRDIDYTGKQLTLRSDNGADYCIIACQGTPEHPHRAIYAWANSGNLHVDGFTITGGYADQGGAIKCFAGNLSLSHCRIIGNYAEDKGGGMYVDADMRQLEDCVIADNTPDGIWMINADIGIEGTVSIVSNDVIRLHLGLPGKMTLASDATIELRDCHVSCDVTGAGTVLVPAGSKTTLAGNTSIWLVDDQNTDLMGLLQCDGRLTVTDHARITDTTIRISPEGLGLTVAADANLTNNDVYTSTGDGYFWLDPNGFRGTLAGNRLYMTVEKGSLLELRGRELPATTASDQAGIVPLSSIPAFDVNSWTIEQLTVKEGARVRLVDRFDDQNDGPVPEVGYIRHIVLEPNAVLDAGIKRLYYGSLQQDPSAQVVSQAVLGFSLGVVRFDDPNVYANRVSNNNTSDRTHVELVTGEPPDPNGQMRMQNLADPDPNSPTYGRMVHARAKARFARSAEDRVLVKFKYLFETPTSNLEMVVSLSDVPELLEPGDPNRALHYKEVGRVFIPSSGWPGSPESGQWGQYEQWISTFGMDLKSGTWVELELSEAANGTKTFAVSKFMAASTGGHGGSAAVDDLAVEVATCGGICMDLNWSTTTNEEDFLMVMASYGGTAGVTADLVGNTTCMEGLFSRDGYVDCYDVFSWDWALNEQVRCNLCAIPMAGEGTVSMGRSGYAVRGQSAQALAAGSNPLPGQLLILGKRSTSEDLSQQKLEDRVYIYDEQGQYGGWVEMGTGRCTQRMIRDGGCLYSLSSETAVCRIRDNGLLEPVVPPSRVSWSSDPRYLRPATIGIGIQGQGNSLSGRPVWDAAFAGQYGYVAPVVVMPEGRLPYRAAAKVELDTQADPPYRVVQLYDDPLLAGGGQSDPNLNGIREIEVDAQGSVYVINADSHTYSDILWAHRPDGKTIDRVVLDKLGIRDPIGLCVSNIDKRVYVGSGYWEQGSSNETVVYGFSTEDLSLVRKVTIRGMQGVTGMAVHPRTGVLWVVGVAFEDRPLMPSPSEPAFYQGYLAVIEPGDKEVEAIPLTGTDTTAGSDLALPTSIVWMGF